MKQQKSHYFKWGLTVFLTVCAILAFYDTFYMNGTLQRYLSKLVTVLAPVLYGFAMALGLLEQKIHARGPGELDEQPAEILHGDMVQPLRVKVDREARRLAGYRYGRQIADDYLTQLGQGEEQVARWLEAENDPRLNEIVSHLNHVVEEARIR